jgi:hypothetical protein
MKPDRQDKTERLEKLIPDFPGYRAGHYLKTDWLLRRFLAGEVEKVRDRLADLLAGGDFPAELRERLALSLRTAAFLKEEMTPAEHETLSEEPLSPLDEERLLDFDLALEEKVAALHTPLDILEAAGDDDDLVRAAELFDEGLAEADDLYRLRRRVLTAGRGGQ